MVKNLLFISRSREKNSENHALHLFNDLIRPVKSAKLLGVEIDDQLSFKTTLIQLSTKLRETQCLKGSCI